MTGARILERPWLVPTLILALACLRLCHSAVLWADEDYHLAAAVHILNGRIPYRDFWYDKPPLSALYYLAIGARDGWSLRLLDAAYVVSAAYLAYAVARDWWGEVEGQIAGLLLAFYTTFYLPSAVVSFAPDALMMVPHLLAVYFARRHAALAAGVAAGVAFLVNAKAVFVLATCIVFLWSSSPALLLGFALPLGAGLGWAVAAGAWAGYREQVWEWGLLYAKGSPVVHPVQLGIERTLDWLGFHAALAVGAAVMFWKQRERWQLGAWVMLSFASVCLGTRFAPHYYLQLLPPLVIAASRGLVLIVRQFGRYAAGALAILLVVPLIRFGPRYVTLAIDGLEGREPKWTDVAMDLDSRHAAEKVSRFARPGDTLFVWGYRPNLYVYTRMSPDGRFWDSQPITGIPADRHLSAVNAIYGGPANVNRDELAHSNPMFIVDGLSPFNPKLDPRAYTELRPWMDRYKLVDRTPLSLIYQRKQR